MPKPIKPSALKSPTAKLQAQLQTISREDMLHWIASVPEREEPSLDLEELYEAEENLRDAIDDDLPADVVMERALDVLEEAPMSMMARRHVMRSTPLAPKFQRRWLAREYRDASEVVGKKFFDDYMGRLGDHPFGLELMFLLADLSVEARGDVPLTLAAGERLLELDLRDPIGLGSYLLGCYLQLERADDALKLINRVTPETPTDRWLLFSAVLLKRAGESERAQQHLERALSVTPYLKTLLDDPSKQNFADGTEPPEGWDEAMDLIDIVVDPWMTDEERAWVRGAP